MLLNHFIKQIHIFCFISTTQHFCEMGTNGTIFSVINMSYLKFVLSRSVASDSLQPHGL